MYDRREGLSRHDSNKVPLSVTLLLTPFEFEGCPVRAHYYATYAHSWYRRGRSQKYHPVGDTYLFSASISDREAQNKRGLPFRQTRKLKYHQPSFNNRVIDRRQLKTRQRQRVHNDI